MTRSLLRAFMTALVMAAAMLVAAPAASADTNEAGTLAVQILAKKVTLQPGGVVRVPIRARCAATLDAFELDVSVRQGAKVGATNLIGEAFPVCDGRWHRTVVTVAADSGRFRPGGASVGVFLGAYDTVEDSDTEATDTARVRLCRPYAVSPA